MFISKILIGASLSESCWIKRHMDLNISTQLCKVYSFLSVVINCTFDKSPGSTSQITAVEDTVKMYTANGNTIFSGPIISSKKSFKKESRQSDFESLQKQWQERVLYR